MKTFVKHLFLLFVLCISFSSITLAGSREDAEAQQGTYDNDKDEVKILMKAIIPKEIYRGNNKISVQLCNVWKGEKVILKVGHKKYTYKIKKNYKKKKIYIKTYRLKGTERVTLSLYGKGNKLLYKDKDVVYYAKYAKLGMTKKQALYTRTCQDYWFDYQEYLYDKYFPDYMEDDDGNVNYESPITEPDDVSYSSGGWESWYWDSGVSLIFHYGRLVHIYI